MTILLEPFSRPMWPSAVLLCSGSAPPPSVAGEPLRVVIVEQPVQPADAALPAVAQHDGRRQGARPNDARHTAANAADHSAQASSAHKPQKKVSSSLLWKLAANRHSMK